MDSLASEMYKEHIIDLYQHPMNFGRMDNASYTYRSFNPLCGDDITIMILVEDGNVSDVKFSGHGCALCIASSSLVTEEIKGKSKDEIMSMKKEDILNLMKINISPVRIKCVLLPLEAIHEAMVEL